MINKTKAILNRHCRRYLKEFYTQKRKTNATMKIQKRIKLTNE
jgi:hypothetical protein